VEGVRAGSDPFVADGTWLRCALHAHTTNSDGELPPDKLVRHYEWAGFDVLAITDHFVRTDASSTDALLVIPSTEIDATAAGENAHLLALGVDTAPPRPDGEFEPLADVVAWIDAHGGVPYLAHTYWSGLRTELWEACPGLVGVEIYNAGCELEVGRGFATTHWDEALERGRLLYGIATDDSHHPGYDSAYAWVWARCGERSRDAVLDALRSGRFYSSTGPVIHELEVDDDAVTVRTSAAASVVLMTGRRRGSSVNAGRMGYSYRGRALETSDDGELLRTRLERPAHAPFGRLEITDARGRRAWTNALWM
jgi:hypothetical protein